MLVAVGVLTVLIVTVFLLRELNRACRSAERLCDILARDLPPTLEALRLTGLEITELTDDMNESVQHVGEVMKQVDQGITSARQQAEYVQIGTRSLWAGARAAWSSWTKSTSRKRPKRLYNRRGNQHSASTRSSKQHRHRSEQLTRQRSVKAKTHISPTTASSDLINISAPIDLSSDGPKNKPQHPPRSEGSEGID